MKSAIVFGNLPIATKVIKELKNNNVDVNGVVIGKVHEKHNDPWPNAPLPKKYCKKNNIHIVSFEDIREGKKYDIGFSVRFNKIIPKKVIKNFSNGIVNFHGGLIPEFRGLYSSCHCILEGEKCGGGTLHYIDEGIDTGKVITRCEFEIEKTDTSLSVFQKTQKALFNKFKKILPNLLENSLDKVDGKLVVRNDKKEGYYDRHSLDGLKCISDDASFDEMYRKARAFDFPGHEPAYIERDGKKLYITTRTFFEEE